MCVRTTWVQQVNKMNHVFISHRVASDRQLARRLYDLLTDMTLEDTARSCKST
eukprot:SAG22_NODE_423_length_10665_cov_7.110543_4_plen_53_part_00